MSRGGWVIRAHAKRKDIVVELEAVKSQTLEGLAAAAADEERKDIESAELEPGAAEEMAIAFDAAAALAQLLPGKGEVEVQASSHSDDDQLQITITASRGAE